MRLQIDLPEGVELGERSARTLPAVIFSPSRNQAGQSMTGRSFSFVYDRASADAAFHGIAPRELMLAILAGIEPDSEWEGCRVYRGESPLAGGTVCIGTSGPAADHVQLRLLAALERLAVEVLAVYEGGPEATEHIAVARAGRWSSP